MNNPENQQTQARVDAEAIKAYAHQVIVNILSDNVDQIKETTAVRLQGDNKRLQNAIEDTTSENRIEELLGVANMIDQTALPAAELVLLKRSFDAEQTRAFQEVDASIHNLPINEIFNAISQELAESADKQVAKFAEPMQQISDHIQAGDVNALRRDLSMVKLLERQFPYLTPAKLKLREAIAIQMYKDIRAEAGRRNDIKQRVEEYYSFVQGEGIQTKLSNIIGDKYQKKLREQRPQQSGRRGGSEEEEVQKAIDELMGNQAHDQLSRFALTQSEIKELYDDPIAFVEHWLRLTEQSGAVQIDLRAQEYMTRLSLAIPHIFSKDIKSAFHVPGGLSEKYNQTYDEFIKDISDRLRYRGALHEMRCALDTMDFKIIMDMVQKLGSGGWFKCMTLPGVQEAFNNFETLMKNEIIELDPNNRDGNKQMVRKKRYTPEDVERFRKKVIVKTTRDLPQARGESDEDYRERVKSTCQIAYNLWTTAMREGLHVSWGLDPVTGQAENTGFYNTKDYHSFMKEPGFFFARLFNMLDFDLHKNFALTPAQRKMVAQMLNYMGGGDQELGALRFRRGIELYDVFSSGWRSQTELQKLLQIYEAMYGELPKDAPLNSENIAGREIFETLALGLKLKRVGKDYRMSRSATNRKDKINLESDDRKKLVHTWDLIAKHRPQEIMRRLAENVRYQMKKDEQTGLYYYGEESGPKANSVGEITRKRLLKEDFVNPFFELIKRDGIKIYKPDGTEVNVNNFLELEEYVGEYFGTINNYLAQEKVTAKIGGKVGDEVNARGLAAIDYSLGFDELVRRSQGQGTRAAHTEAQLACVKEVFMARHGNEWENHARNYFSVMKHLSDISQGSIQTSRGQFHVINELVDNPDYESLYGNTTLFFDDMRFAQLQDIDPRLGVEKISYTFGPAESTGGGDMMIGAWGDMSAANKVVENVSQIIRTYDQTKFVESITEAFQNVRGIEGPEEGARLVAELGVGWMSLAKIPLKNYMLGLDRVPLGIVPKSEAQKLFGEGAPALDPNELQNLQDAINLGIGGRLGEFLRDSDLINEYNSQTGLRRAMKGYYNSRNVILMILVLMIQKMMEEATKADAA